MSNLISIHFSIICLVSLFSFSITYLYLPSYELIMKVTLLTLLLNNVFLVAGAMIWMRMRYIHIVIYFLVFINLLVGLYSYGITQRLIIDFSYIFLFLTKILLIKQVVSSRKNYLLIKRWIVIYIYVSLFSSILGTLFFYILPQNANAYVGLTPPIVPYLIYSVVGSNFVGILIALVIVTLSGKRAMMISSILVLFLGLLNRNTKKNALLLFGGASALVLVTFLVLQSNNITFAPIEKISGTVSMIMEGDLEKINRSTGMRAYEVSSIIGDMHWRDYILGKGPGYTYDLIIDEVVVDEDHANAHFSPVSLISKYGLVVFLVFSVVAIKLFGNKHRGDAFYIFLKLYLLAFFIESLFSYLIFNDKILAFVIGILLVKPSKMRSNNEL